MTLAHLDQFNGRLIDGLEFCSRVYFLFETIRREPDGPSRFRMRPTRLEKRLLEELLPIARYVQASYRPGRYISVRWVDGSQNFDAEIHQRGAYVTPSYYPEKAYLEVTCAVHPNEYLLRERLETKGLVFGLEGLNKLKDGEIESIPVGYSGREFIDSYAKIVMNQVGKKGRKGYPANTILIVQCTLNSAYLPNEWADLMEKLKREISGLSFLEIYLYDSAFQYSHSFFPSPQRA